MNTLVFYIFFYRLPQPRRLQGWHNNNNDNNRRSIANSDSATRSYLLTYCRTTYLPRYSYVRTSRSPAKLPNKSLHTLHTRRASSSRFVKSTKHHRSAAFRRWRARADTAAPPFSRIQFGRIVIAPVARRYQSCARDRSSSDADPGPAGCKSGGPTMQSSDGKGEGKS